MNSKKITVMAVLALLLVSLGLQAHPLPEQSVAVNIEHQLTGQTLIAPLLAEAMNIEPGEEEPRTCKEKISRCMRTTCTQELRKGLCRFICAAGVFSGIILLSIKS